MAVLSECLGLKVEVIVNKQPLTEYDNDDEEESPNTVTKYTEAQSGLEYVLKWTFSEPFQKKHGVLVGIWIDGEYSTGTVFRPELLFESEGYLCHGVDYIKDGQSYCRNYQFTALNIGKAQSELSDCIKINSD